MSCEGVLKDEALRFLIRRRIWRRLPRLIEGADQAVDFAEHVDLGLAFRIRLIWHSLASNEPIPAQGYRLSEVGRVKV